MVAFALVVGLADRVGAQGGEDGGEHGALEPLVASVGDAPRRGSMSPMSWLPVPGWRRRLAGLRYLEVLGQSLGQQGRLRLGPLIPGTCGQDLAHEGGPPARVTGLGGDIGPLSVQGDELPGQVGQNHCGGVGAGDSDSGSDTLAFQGRDDLGCPGGVPPAPVLLEPCVSPCLARSLQIGWGGPGCDRPPEAASCARPGPHHGP